jgi:predicted DNA-binding transcriptional regulator YafY
MPVNKKALSRYLIIDKCLRNTGRKYYLKDLLEEVNRCLREEGFESIGRTQIYKDLNDLEYSTYKAPVKRIKDGRKVYFRYADPKYSITNQPINEVEANQIREALVVLSRFKGMPQFEWVNELIPRLEQSFKLKSEHREIISFDNNEFLTGIEHVGPLFNAILYNKVLKLEYKSFKNEAPETIIFQPHYLKQYNSRWFVLGYTEGYETLSPRPLDRIIDIKETAAAFRETEAVDFVDYFEDIVGITRHENLDCEKIVLKFSRQQAPYIRTKPIHGSQKVVADREDGLTISLELIPNYEFETLLLSFGEKVQLISPEHLKDAIKQRLQSALEAY